jgi:hypothetical protein
VEWSYARKEIRWTVELSYARKEIGRLGKQRAGGGGRGRESMQRRGGREWYGRAGDARQSSVLEQDGWRERGGAGKEAKGGTKVEQAPLPCGWDQDPLQSSASCSRR